MRLFEEFKSVSKSEWLDHVSKKLRGQKMEDLNFDLGGLKHLSPFFHSEDITQDIQIPSPAFDRACLGFALEVTDPVIDNQLILEQLEAGVGFLSLDLRHTPQIDFDALLSGVLVDMIYLELIFDTDRLMFTNFIDYMTANYDLNTINQCYVETPFAQQHPFRTVRCIPSNSTPIDGEALQALLKDGQDYLATIEDKGRIIFRLDFDHNYLLNICRARAARLLWANLCVAHGKSHKKIPIIVVGTVSDKLLQGQHHDNMIALSQIGVSMLSGGVDVLMIPPGDANMHKNGSKFGRRISRNIFHLMSLESQMDKVSDPASGSYFFDKTTIDLAKSAWDHFAINKGDA